MISNLDILVNYLKKRYQLFGYCNKLYDKLILRYPNNLYDKTRSGYANKLYLQYLDVLRPNT